MTAMSNIANKLGSNFKHLLLSALKVLEAFAIVLRLLVLVLMLKFLQANFEAVLKYKGFLPALIKVFDTISFSFRCYDTHI